MSKTGEYVRCPLCGALVKRSEIEERGYYAICRLLIEALTTK